MARLAKDKDEVFLIIDQISADIGKVPTVSQVREQLGGGSFSTLGPIVAEWREKMRLESEIQVPDIPKVAHDAFKRVWTLALEESQKCFDVERKALDETRQAIESDIAKLLAENEKLESENNRISVLIEVRAKNLKEADDKIVGLQNDIATLKSENDLIQATVEREQIRSDKLQSQLLEIAKATQPKPQASITRRKSKDTTTSEQAGV